MARISSGRRSNGKVLVAVLEDTEGEAFETRGVERRMSFSGLALLFSRTIGSKADGGSTLSKMRPMSARSGRV